MVDKGMTFVGDVSPGFVKTLGAAEVAGAVGVILPAVVNIAPILVPIAASCCALVMVGAVVVHMQRREWSGLVAPVALLCVAAVVA
ncbi:MAG: DoxX family protein [Mycobacterium sp.]|nr:DoxX family protein [Mycobacterium sp.]